MRSFFVLVLLGVAQAQLGFFDLDADEGTKFSGTTGDVLPHCLSMPTGLCSDGGRTIVSPDARVKGVTAFYDFDDAYALDKSGNANHPLSPPPGVGPGHDGRGQSARFTGSQSFVVPHISGKEDRVFSVSCWVYLLSEPTESWRVVFRKGDIASDMTPMLMLFPDSNKLHLRLSTTDPTKNAIDSVAVLPIRRWTHIALTVEYNVASLYINGILDNKGLLTGEVLANSGSWHIGSDITLPGTSMFLDNFKIYDSALTEEVVQVEASSALPGLGPNFLRLGCMSCEMKDAIEKCASTGGYHLCRRIELESGGLAVARAMGYLTMSSEQWVAEDEEPKITMEKLGLCCLD